MWCPKCGNEKSRVIGTEKSGVVERYRKCPACNHSFATIEAVKFDPDWEADAAYTGKERKRIVKRYSERQEKMFK